MPLSFSAFNPLLPSATLTCSPRLCPPYLLSPSLPLLPQATLRRTLKPRFHRRAKPLSGALFATALLLSIRTWKRVFLQIFRGQGWLRPSPDGRPRITRIPGKRCMSNPRSPFSTSLFSVSAVCPHYHPRTTLYSPRLNAPRFCDKYLLSRMKFVPSYFRPSRFLCISFTFLETFLVLSFFLA